MPRIALQGGGARLADLLAAASAIYRAGIGCNAYAGTSAGSIVAALLAADVDPRRLRDYFLRRRHVLERLVPGRGIPAIIGYAIKVAIRGKPLIDLEVLRSVLLEAFADVGISASTSIRDLPHTLFIVAANVRDNEARIYRDDDNLLDSVVRSCAIPIVFTASTTQDRHIVDGGVFNNLPVDVLLEGQCDPEEVMAFAFKDDFHFDPRNALQYVLDLFSAMIDARVQDSVVRVGPDNVCVLDSKISSFNVAQFFDGLSDGAFNAREKEVAKWLKSWISKARAQYSDLRGVHRHPAHYSRYLCGKVRAMEEMFVDAPPRVYEIVDVSIIPSVNEEDDGYDALIYSAKLLPDEDRAQHSFTCYTVAPNSAHELISADWQVLDEDGRSVPHVAFPLVDPTSPRTKVVLFFGQPIEPVKKGGRAYTIRQRQIIKGLMRDLLPKDQDWFAIKVLEGETMKKLRISLATRRGWGEFRQEAKEGSPGAACGRCPTENDERNIVAWEAQDLKAGDRVHLTYSRRTR